VTAQNLLLLVRQRGAAQQPGEEARSHSNRPARETQCR